jgi:mannopine transport system permease protein
MKTRSALLGVPLLFYIAVCIALPLAWTIPISLGAPKWTFQNYRHILAEPVYRRVMVTTLRLAGFTTVLTFCLGYPFGYLLGTSRPGKLSRFGLSIVLYSLWVSLLARNLAWIALLQQSGPVAGLLRFLVPQKDVQLLYTLGGAVVAMTHILLPLQILPVYASARAVDPLLLNAARSLGANATRVWWYVGRPLTSHAAAGGAAFVFLSALGFYITPALVGGVGSMTVSMLIDDMINHLLLWGPGFALSNLLVCAVVVIELLFVRLVLTTRGRVLP